MFDNFLWGLMPHAHCIGNGFIVWATVITSFYIFVCYLVFRSINGKVIRSHAGNVFFRTRSTFVGFRNVFLWCGLSYFMLAVTMFLQVYLLALIILIIDAYWITITVIEFKNNLPEFMNKPMSKDIAKASLSDLRYMLSEARMKISMLETELDLNDMV